VKLLATGLTGRSQTSDVSRSPSVPLGNVPLSLGELLRTASVLLGRILLVERSGVLLELLSDLALGVLGEQCRWSRSPQELLESVFLLGNKLGTFEVPDLVSRLGLKVASANVSIDCSISTHSLSPRRGRGTEVPSRWVPSDVGDTVVLSSTEQLDVCSGLGLSSSWVVIGDKIEIPELDVELGRRTDGRKHNVSTLGRPKERVGDLAVKVLDRRKVALLRVKLVEVDVVLEHNTGDLLTVVRVVGRDNGESVALGLPSELGDVV
jgi:hypothetical protein